jgi:hypothetical protein
VLSLVDSVSEEKMEERFFHDRLNCLVERGGETLRRGVPYIYERVCSIPSEKYNGRIIIKVQVCHLKEKWISIVSQCFFLKNSFSIAR